MGAMGAMGARPQDCKFIKNRLQHRCFSMSPFVKNRQLGTILGQNYSIFYLMTQCKDFSETF